jgi:alkanesulfonate monooxygenase SsuD/methylene tetrahydromethanopterin reductase-like flavin-dependent oxidoreductase (luciferase family)
MKASLLCGAHYEGAGAHFHQPPVSPSLCDPAIAQQSYDHYLNYAARADELGFDWISVSEHHSSPLILAPSIAPLAGALTQITRRARIALFGPLAPLNNPVRVAEEIAVLDQLSHGRLIVLPLRGTPGEFNSLGPIDGSTTQPMTQEAARLIRKALAESEPFAWDGEYFHFPNVAVWPRPIQRPYPPMYFSANSPNSAMFAADERMGMCMSFHRPEVVAGTVAMYREQAAHVGWQPQAVQIVYRGFVIVADTDERAEELEAAFITPQRRFLLDAPSPGPVAAAGPATEVDPALVERARLAFPRGRMAFAGSPDSVADRIQLFGELTGVGVVDLIFGSGTTSSDDVERSIELFGREVLPRLHALPDRSAVTTSATG